ncbi:hypothetical protein [Legionella bononiensis]|uniref:Uncharacterized protein n=2 Tax=Legionella bononiensis TaxID=2793102 RepID=A0ABS1WD97_9GAMM|nr:hypothetical protein [Legionella bononiensis]MBL7481218.1 hypothetical protein [Legionella bononiensis]MBL7527324.1 hypothetical protein [Legionella bononiensis]MBL7562293.1 hypothetical protein [Legionella bononiensis]
MNDVPEKNSHKTRAVKKKVNQLEQDDHQTSKSQTPQKKHSVKPAYFKNISGYILVLIATLGVILTSPLAIFSGLFGLIYGAFTHNNLLTSGLRGAKIGSLGTVYAFNLGLDLTQATVETEDSTTPQIPLLMNEAEKSESDSNQKPIIKALDNTGTTRTFKTGTTDVQDTFFAKQQVKPQSNLFKTTVSHQFNNPEDVKAFTVTINQLIKKDESNAVRKKREDVPKVKEPYIVKLIEVIKNPKSSDHEFWDRLNQMSDTDIQVFVGKLSPLKGKGPHSLSELDFLWRQFNGVEFEPSKRENKRNKFALVLESLSETQLTASFDSPEFLGLLNKDAYIEAAANTLNRNQLNVFASDNKKHDMLNSMIKKLRPDPYLLGKLVSIIPHATGKVKTALIDQITHLAHPASFKIELTKLAEHYIAMNTQHTIHHTVPAASVTRETAPSKWATVKAPVKPVYATPTVVLQKEWTDEAFAAFIHDLNATTYLINENKLIEDLNTLPAHRVKMIAERAASPDCNNLLTHFWRIEAKPLNHKSDIDNREQRLKIILQHITEDQLIQSINENKFWEIFRNVQEPFCKMAAGILTPKQFETISSNSPIERHSDFAVLISQLTKDSPAEKERFHQIIEAILPHTTPWLVLVLERQIKSLIAGEKPLYERFNAELKQNLTASLERLEVKLKYQKDNTLNKTAIAQLLVEPHEHQNTSPRLSS